MSAELTAPALQDGDRLDIFDGDGIWNVEQVLRPPTPETVEVTCVQRGAKARQRADCSLSHAHVDCQVLGEDRYVARWPALLTGRAPRSAQGSHNLRLAGRLLVDFLDKVEGKERCRCCVEKSNATAYQSDEEARSMLTKLKKKNKNVADKHLPPTDQQETSAAVKRNVTSESKAVEESTSPMKNLARLTKATVRADEQLQNVETALESKLTELAEKSAKAEGLRNKYAALSKLQHSFAGGMI
ncbi:hypothetical protein PInf_000434 [Phytophthora infestans]|nr:hypothetical protein PInf_000434 [Phytophthora infestans]